MKVLERFGTQAAGTVNFSILHLLIVKLLNDKRIQLTELIAPDRMLD